MKMMIGDHVGVKSLEAETWSPVGRKVEPDRGLPYGDSDATRPDLYISVSTNHSKVVEPQPGRKSDISCRIPTNGKGGSS